jgi:hypothetical protein
MVLLVAVLRRVRTDSGFSILLPGAGVVVVVVFVLPCRGKKMFVTLHRHARTSYSNQPAVAYQTPDSSDLCSVLMMIQDLPRSGHS